MNQVNNTQGLGGIRKDVLGNEVLIRAPRDIWETIEEKVIRDKNGLMDEVDVQRTFHISKKTLSNYCSNGKIPEGYYTTAFNGHKFFFENKLYGLE